MSFQSIKHQLVLHPVRPMRTFQNGEVYIHETICIRNPYEFTLLEDIDMNGCWLNYRGLTVQIKETIDEIAVKYDDFKKCYEEEANAFLYKASPDILSMMM